MFLKLLRELSPMRPSNQSNAIAKDPTTNSDKFEDPVEETGCQAQNDAVLLCFSETHDWRKCQPEIEAFRACYQEYTEKRREETVAKIRTTIRGILDETLVDVERELAERMGGGMTDPDPDSMSSIPFSTEQ